MIDGEEMTAEMRTLDSQLIEALERKPRIMISKSFATRVALHASALHVHAFVRTSRFGASAVAVCAVLTVVAMLLLAPQTAGHDVFWMALQWMLCGEFCALTAWLGLSRQVE